MEATVAFALPTHSEGAQRVHVRAVSLCGATLFEYIHMLPAHDWLDDEGCRFYLNDGSWCSDSLRDTPALATLMEALPDCPCFAIRLDVLSRTAIH